MTRRIILRYQIKFQTVLIIILLLATALISQCRAAKQKTIKYTDNPQVTTKYPVNEDKYWQEAQKEVYRDVADLLTQHGSELARGVKYHKFFSGDPSVKQIAITFDDGPHPKYTQKILSILKKYDVKATFFVVGKLAEIHPDLIQAEIADGHNVGNHTYNHINLKKTPDINAAVEIKACGEVIESITGKAPHLFRPPGGDYNRQVAEAAEALGYTMVLWTDDPGDYASPGAALIKNRIFSKLSSGGIILIHDGIQQTVDDLPGIIKHLRKKGYQIVTIDEMMKQGKK